MNVISALVYGLIYGLSEFFPVSAPAHQRFFEFLTGITVAPQFHCVAHLGGFLALLFHFFKRLEHIRRELRIAGKAKHHRKRQPDTVAIADGKLILMSAIPMVAGFLFMQEIEDRFSSLWIMAIMLMINGFMLYMPQFFPWDQKDGRAMSRMDGLLYGLCAVLSTIPGISRVNIITNAARVRGGSRVYAMDLALMISIVYLFGLLILDVIAAAGAAVLSGWIAMLALVLCGAAAFAASYVAIALIRYLAVKIGFSGFAYYSWGLGFACFILYLMI